MLLGATTSPAGTPAMLAKLGPVAYTRDFGLKKGQLLPPHDGSKMTVPEGVIVHVSWKGPMAQLSAWLDGLRRPIWLTRRHEPHGDITPAALRAECAEMVPVLDSHPNRHLVLGHGPIVTRYWLSKVGSDPADWWYDGATCFGVDAYNGKDMTRYRSAEEMFGAAVTFAREQGVPFMVPELGAERTATDTSGAARAAAIRAWIAWLRAQPDCLAAGWWWHGGDLPAPGSPEEIALIEAMEESAMARITWLADVLRAAGVEVVEHSGWKTHERPGTWTPQFGIVHATAAPRTQSDAVQVGIVRDGRRNADGTFLKGPIANACVDRKGRWHVLGAGRCNTTLTGTAGPYEGKGNTYALGVEACNDNRDEPWPEVQYGAYVRGFAAIAKRMGWEPSHLRGHKEHTPGRKTDPTFSMGQFRSDVASVLAGEDDDMPTAAEIASAVVSRLDTAPIRNGRTIGGTLDALAELAHGTRADVAGVAAAVAGVDEEVLARLTEAGRSLDAVAAALVAALGAEQARQLGALLAAS